MKISLGVRRTAFLVFAWWIITAPLAAQFFGLSVSNPPTPVPTNSTFNYLITVTNAGSVANVFVTNALSGPAQVTSALPITLAGFLVSSNAITAVFGVDGQFAQFVLTVRPSAAGFVTNTVTVAAPFSSLATPVTTNVVNEVTNGAAASTQADLAVTITGPGQAVIANDAMTFGLTVSNLGPQSASGVLLSNSTSAFLLLLGISNTNVPLSITNELLVLNLGALDNGAVTNVVLRVQPTNSGLLTLSAAVGATTPDPNTTNNTAVTNIVVTNYLSGKLAASFVDPTQYFNAQNGLVEQKVRLSNVGTSAVASARLVVSGLTGAHWLFNASGTNNGDPFVVYTAALGPGQNVNLLMQYLVPTGGPFALTTNELAAYEVPPVRWTVPANPGSPVEITRELQLPSGDILIEFPSILGRSYTVVYSDDLLTNVLLAPPSIAAPGDRMQWIDYGPPTTPSRPAGTNSRSYRVYLDP